MSVRSGQSITRVFTTRRFDTGAAANADSTPTGTLYVNGTADAASVTVTNVTTGVYRAAVTLPTLSIGDVVDLRISATVNSVTDNAVIWSDSKDVALDSSGRPGVDWANVGSPTTTLNLSGTTIKTATDVETDTQDLQSRLPAALTADGNIKADALKLNGATPNNVAATDIVSAGAITTSSGAVVTVTSVTNRVTANTDQIEGVDATNQIRDAILSDATRFAGANVDAAISTRLAASGYTAPDNATIAAIAGYVDTEVAAIKARTDKLTFDGSNNVLSTPQTAVTIAGTTGTLDALQTALSSEHGAGSWATATGFSTLDAADVRDAVGLASANLDTQLGALGSLIVGLNDLSAADILDAALAGHTTAGTVGEVLNGLSNHGDPWSTILPGSYGAGTAGYLLGNNPDSTGITTLLSRLTNSRALLLDNLAGIGAVSIAIISPLARNADVTVLYGDDYAAADGRSLDWTGTGWPDLTGATISFNVDQSRVQVPGAVVTPTAPAQIRVELTAAQTVAIGRGSWHYDVTALISGRRITLVRGTLSVLASEE